MAQTFSPAECQPKRRMRTGVRILLFFAWPYSVHVTGNVESRFPDSQQRIAISLFSFITVNLNCLIDKFCRAFTKGLL